MVPGPLYLLLCPPYFNFIFITTLPELITFSLSIITFSLPRTAVKVSHVAAGEHMIPGPLHLLLCPPWLLGGGILFSKASWYFYIPLGTIRPFSANCFLPVMADTCICHQLFSPESRLSMVADFGHHSEKTLGQKWSLAAEVLTTVLCFISSSHEFWASTAVLEY
jgi:hypothetical protein